MPRPSPQDYPKILRWVRTILPDGAIDHEDLAMKIWLECWEKECRPSFRITRLRSYDWLRGLHPSESLPSEPLAPHDDPTERRDYVRHLMDTSNLTENERRVIYLCYYQGLSCRDAAENLNLSERRTGIVLSEALEKIRRTTRKDRE